MNNRLPFFIDAIAPYCRASRIRKLPSLSLVWSICSTGLSDRSLPNAIFSLCRAAISFTTSPTVVLCHDFSRRVFSVSRKSALRARIVRRSGAPVCSISSTVNAPFGKSGCPFQPSASVITAPRRGSTIFPSASSSSRSSWSASKPRLSVSVKLIRRLSSTVVISLPSILMLNAGVLLPLLSSSELKFTTAALPPFY